MMSNYVLIIVRNNVVLSCEVYSLEQDALRAGRLFCELNGLPYRYDPYFDKSIKIRVICEEYGYSVTIGRNLSESPSVSNSALFNSYYFSGSSKDSNVSETVEQASEDFNDIDDDSESSKATFTDPIKDDARDLNLPGGFDYLDRQPIFMHQIKAYTHFPINTSSLQEKERWALITARVKHRPFIQEPNKDKMIYDSRLLNQQEILTELKNKTAWAKAFVDKEMKIVAEMYDSFDEDLSDEESSSSSDEESEY